MMKAIFNRTLLALVAVIGLASSVQSRNATHYPHRRAGPERGQ